MLISGRTALAEYAGASITGRCRAENEDALGVVEGSEVFVVADGCGGFESGRRASDLAVATLQRLFASPEPRLPGAPQGETLAAALHLANQAIREDIAATPGRAGMGSTIVAVRLLPRWVSVAHVGDCRLYRFRRSSQPHQPDRVERLTVDHLLWSELLRMGYPVEQVLQLRESHSNVLTRALGVQPEVAIDVQYLPAESADMYLLCTDGVTGQLNDDEIGAIVTDEAQPLAVRCAKLVEATDSKAGQDNATALLLRLMSSSASPCPGR